MKKHGETAEGPIQMKTDEAGVQSYAGVLVSEDSVLRWVYELDMWRNPTVLVTVWKIFGMCSLLPGLIVFFGSINEGIEAALFNFLKVASIMFGIMTVLVFFAYAVLAAIYGGKYCVAFEMDKDGVRHIQMKKQFEKGQLMAMLAIVAGLATGNAAAAAAGLNAASMQSQYSQFNKVKSIVVNEKRQVIYVNQTLIHNQVYADPGYFTVVLDYILKHCGKQVPVKYR
nr:hypothetical protein [uncultured Trichococcus sp.]